MNASNFLRRIVLGFAMTAALTACNRQATETKASFNESIAASDKVEKSEAEWQKILTPERFRVLRKKGTEAPFTNQYANNHEAGVYRCAGCDLELFSSEAKFESGTGWPSFFQPIGKGKVALSSDFSLGMSRDEVHCNRCGGHLGHVFNDGPQPTGLRYCMNSAAMKFVKKE